MRVTWLLLFVYGVPVACPAVRANPKPAESPQTFRHQVGAEAPAVVRAMLRNYRLITSLHFVATIIGRRSYPMAPQASGAVKERYVFWGAGRRFRVKYSVVLPTVSVGKDCQDAFDGTRFQELTESNRSLFIGKRRPARAAGPGPRQPGGGAGYLPGPVLALPRSGWSSTEPLAPAAAQEYAGLGFLAEIFARRAYAARTRRG